MPAASHYVVARLPMTAKVGLSPPAKVADDHPSIPIRPLMIKVARSHANLWEKQPMTTSVEPIVPVWLTLDDLELIERCLEADTQVERRVQLVLVLEAVLDALGRQLKAA